MKKINNLAKKMVAFGLMAIMMIGTFSVYALASNITSQRAEEIALGVYPGAAVIRTKQEFKRRTNTSYFEVYLEIDGVRVEVKVDADTGALRAGYDTNLLNQASITPSQARNTAVGLHPGSIVTKTELEFERDVLVYEVNLQLANGRRAEVEINATTGAVLKNKTK